jgi:hypothetical protein
MIQIKRKNLNSLADEHCKELKPLLESRMRRRRAPLFIYLRDNLDRILSGRPDVLQEVIDEVPPVLHHSQTLKKIFNYDSFVRTYSDEKYGAYKLAEKLQVNCCPYCNRQYTFTLRPGKNGKGKTRPQFDHFYPQYQHPYLSLSFFNLIPSCSICNSSFKNTALFSLENNVHPYLGGFEDTVKFKIELRSKEKFKPEEIKKWYGANFFFGSQESFDVKISVNNPVTDNETKANGNIKTFQLEILYNKHKDYIMQLVQAAEIYNPDYVTTIYEAWEGKLFSSINEVHQMILSNYISPEDFEKRIFSKFTRDISQELGLIS